MTTSELLIHVNVGDFDQAPGSLLERAVRHTVSGEGRSGGEVSLTLLDDGAIQALNRDYLGKDSITDVISFSLGEDGELLGDIYVGMSQAERQAVDVDVPLDEELARLAIHGVLHVLGYDHPAGPEREDSPMYALQEVYLQGVLADEERRT